MFGEEDRVAYDRRRAERVHVGHDGRGTLARRRRATTTPSTCTSATRSSSSIARPRRSRRPPARRSPTTRSVLATGSSPFVPPIPGHDLPGCFVYRTIDDLDAIRAATQGKRVGAVIGGGLLGLEAANALQLLGLETHVVEFAPRLMPLQVDDGGGATLRAHIEALGITVHTGASTQEIVAGARRACRAACGSPTTRRWTSTWWCSPPASGPATNWPATAASTSASAAASSSTAACRTSDPTIYAIGECALAEGRIWGLVAPGYDMARVAADQMLGGDATFGGADLSTKLKLMGVDVAVFGDAFAATEGAARDHFRRPDQEDLQAPRRQRRRPRGARRRVRRRRVGVPDAVADGAGRHAHARAPRATDLPGGRRIGAPRSAWVRLPTRPRSARATT